MVHTMMLHNVPNRVTNPAEADILFVPVCARARHAEDCSRCTEAPTALQQHSVQRCIRAQCEQGDDCCSQVYPVTSCIVRLKQIELACGVRAMLEARTRAHAHARSARARTHARTHTHARARTHTRARTCVTAVTGGRTGAYRGGQGSCVLNGTKYILDTRSCYDGGGQARGATARCHRCDSRHARTQGRTHARSLVPATFSSCAPS